MLLEKAVAAYTGVIVDRAAVLSGGRGGGSDMVRAYADFAGASLGFSAELIGSRLPYLSDLYSRAACASQTLRAALEDARVEYLGRDAHTAEGRLNRYLQRVMNANN